MASANKTENLGLNKWVGSDKPKREDFVNDNMILDSVISQHKNDDLVHLTGGEREKWNTPFTIGTYIGDGENQKVITLSNTPTFGLVFAAGYPLFRSDYKSSRHDHNFAICTEIDSSFGAKLENNQLIVYNSVYPELDSEKKNLNKSGVMYIYIMFR